ncbi:MAG: autoinducer binding domain-containing protein, partial [Pseudomonadota bacterium]
MSTLLGPDEIGQLAPSGHYIALRIGFAFPMEEVNAFPEDWISHYTKQRFMLFDPIVRWAYSNTGTIRWSEISI